MSKKVAEVKNLTTVEEKEVLQHTAPNNPNASILIYAMQHLGYDNYVALCDIIDNSIDAGATNIKVNISSSDNIFKIVIIDNGHGMTYEILDEALKFGSNCHHDDLVDLGKFGMGLCTAGLSIANKTTVLTKVADDEEIYKSVTDVEIIRNQNEFVKYIGKASELEKQLFESELVGETSGTIIILEKCFGIKNKNITQFSNKLTKEVSRIFRRFMGKITFIINGKTVRSYDPLMLDENDTNKFSEIYSDEDYDVHWISPETGKEVLGSVHAKLVLLPNFSKETNRDLGINIPNQGFSVMRNNREIAFGFMPWGAKHNGLNRVRGEISFDSSLDEAMGVDFTKNGIDMLDSVDHALRAALLPQITAMRRKAEMANKASDEERVGHEEAENQINKKRHLLITPPAQKEKRNSPVKKDNHVNNKIEPTEEEKQRRERMPKKFQGVNANVRFDLYHFGTSGAIFEAEQEGKTIVIKWNVDHPFYDRFVVENKDNRNLVSSIDFLIYSLAAAQIQAVGEDEDKAIMIDSIISTMSTNMKALLS